MYVGVVEIETKQYAKYRTFLINGPWYCLVFYFKNLMKEYEKEKVQIWLIALKYKSENTTYIIELLTKIPEYIDLPQWTKKFKIDEYIDIITNFEIIEKYRAKYSKVEVPNSMLITSGRYSIQLFLFKDYFKILLCDEVREEELFYGKLEEVKTLKDLKKFKTLKEFIEFILSKKS